MKIIAMIPTYNEAGNIARVAAELRALPGDMHVLVVDDNSPDGTSRIVEGLAAKDDHVHLLLRKERRGRGWAGIDGFKQALAMGADAVVEMDGDGSHAPRFVPALLEALTRADIAVGSRYVAGGSDEERTILRRAISNFARRYLAFMLGVKVADPTSGFRAFRRSALERIVPRLAARDPFIVSEVLFFSRINALSVVEVPIEFMSRLSGESKLKASTLLKYLVRVIALRFSA